MSILDSPESILMHPTRRRIYELCVMSPGTNFSKIAEFLEIANSTISWHLKRLEESGLVKSIKISGKRIYVPVELRDELAEEIYVILDNEIAKKIFVFILNNPDTYPLDIARNIGIHHESVRYHLLRLEKLNLIKSTKKSKLVTIQVGERAIQLRKASLNVLTDNYINFLTEFLKSDCLYPEITEKTDHRLTLRIDCPDGDEIIMDLRLSDWGLLTLIEEEEKEN
ncbi:MAG: winged helix-turn-helix transcriptional regulator [Candidatus Hodarchaeales archaeon]|jgi:DNA-binding transcriptional ArsR family regulator